MVKPSKLFGIAVKEILKTQNMTQKRLAEDLTINPILMNDYLKGRKNFSEDRMSLIAGHLDHSILEMLLLGHQLATGIEPVAPEIPVNLKDVILKLEGLDQESLKLISALADKLPRKESL